MKRRAVFGAAALGLLAGASAGHAAPLPAVLGQAAQPTPLATRSALLAAARAGQRLVLAGERGLVVYSDNGGQQWQQAEVPAQVSLTALAFANAQQGWACGHFGSLLQTRDGGQRWQLVLDGQRLAELELAAAGDDEALRNAAQRRLAEGPDKPLLDLSLSPDGALYAVGAYGLAFVRQGEAWQSLHTRLPNRKRLHLYAVRSDGPRVFIAGEQGLLLRSLDGGAHFEALPSPYKGSFFGLLLTREGTLLAYGLRGNVWRSADQGDSWTAVANPVPVSLSAGLQRQDGSLLLLAQNGDLLHSRDDGRSFLRHNALPPLPSASLVEADAGHVVLAGLRGLQRLPLSFI
ncbi:YCF48-related protein [Roseateles sp.]|uniref:WD40/YVTN/BNR-like repeat-containing protein n=1 Tax=Roseateles sp. TaxID=1971397 RepID=UPI0032669FFE